MTIAYLANCFPEPLESYVGDEIIELRTRGCPVVPCSVRQPGASSLVQKKCWPDTRYIFPLRLRPALAATWLCLRKSRLIAGFVWRAACGPEPLFRRCRTLAHTWLGAYLATLLTREKIQHFHVHHGYFAAWVGMVAARLLDAGFSLTLHGSDLLLRADYLDAKLSACRFCLTVSEFNRRYILDRGPRIEPRKIFVQRLGVDLNFWRPESRSHSARPFSILSVGRLHAAKNHSLLLLACAALKAQGTAFRCVIAGEGEERGKLEQLTSELDLGREVTLRGHVQRDHLPSLYAEADVVVLTSRSEGLPVTLMEAMAMERLVLAPNITGIPELVTDGQTGFLYPPNSMDDFLAKLQLIRRAGPSLETVRRAARRHVELAYNRRRNLAAFAERFLQQIGGPEQLALEIATGGPPRKETYEDPVLQQVQLRIQRDRSLPV